MRSVGSEFVTFNVFGTIQFINECLQNTVSTLSPQIFALASQVTFMPDLSTVYDMVSFVYSIEDLCGSF